MLSFYLLIINAIFLSLLCACDRLPAPAKTTTLSTPTEMPGDICQHHNDVHCAEKKECIFNSLKNLCEAKLSGQECRDLSASQFQCDDAPLRSTSPFGCVFKHNSCIAAKSCKDIVNQSQCDRAKDKNCHFLDNSCQEHVPIDVYALLANPNQDLQKWFHEAFSAFGAFLLYYQELAPNMNKAGIESAMNAAFGVKLPGDSTNNTWLGTPINEEHIADLAAIDKTITDPAVRKIWLAWLHHPANFLSWIIYPVAHQDSSDLLDLKTKFMDLRRHGNLLAWFDDGLCMFSWIMELKLPRCPPPPVPRPNPKQWLRSIKNDVATVTDDNNK